MKTTNYEINLGEDIITVARQAINKHNHNNNIIDWFLLYTSVIVLTNITTITLYIMIIPYKPSSVWKRSLQKFCINIKWWWDSYGLHGFAGSYKVQLMQSNCGF